MGFHKYKNYTFVPMQWLRNILFPFSVLYGIIIGLRNKCFDWGILPAERFEIPILCVGNLNVGGTGKSPMTEYLIRLLKDNYSLATLSRGYGRTTKGFKTVTTNSLAQDVGDEPLQFKRKFPKVTVAVDAKRVHGIQTLLKNDEHLDLILLDDAYQHRYVAPSFTILLTAFNDLYAKDYMLPTGNLREPRHGSNRADIIVVTKSPINLKQAEKSRIIETLKPEKRQAIFFGSIGYSEFIYNENERLSLSAIKDKHFTLVTGIANPEPLVKFLNETGLNFEHLNFPDHYNFKPEDLDLLRSKDFLLTTEKDFVRLQGQVETPLFYLPIETIIDDEDNFNSLVINHLN